MIKLKKITKLYDKGKTNELRALNNLNLDIEDGDFIAILGVSGSGKTTLVNILGMMDNKYSGEYWWNNENVKLLKENEICRYRNERIGFVVQDFALVEYYSVRENICIPLNYSAVKRNKKEKERLISSSLEKLGIADKTDVNVGKLSGGQRQRVAIARAIINDPSLILADEPTGALDCKNTEEIMKLLTELNKSGKTIVVITHDNLVAEYCNKVYKMVDGNIEMVRG